MAWIVLAVSIAFEVTGTMLMKLSNGLTVLWPSLGVLACYTVSLAGLTIVMRHIDLPVAYAVWSGAGVALAAILGLVVFGEALTAWKLLFLGLIIAGVIGLNLTSGAH